MKKILFAFIILALMVPAFAGGRGEPPREITYLGAGNAGIDPAIAYALGRFNEDYPDVAVRFLQLDLSDGSTMTMDALLAAGRGPNIYDDTIVRTSRYIVPEYAYPLQRDLRDLGEYFDGVLDPFWVGGDLLAVPRPGSAPQGFAINLEIMAEIGYTVPDRWTIDDFMEMAALVKARYGGERWATGMFAANQSGDYLINNWFDAFGVDYFTNGRVSLVETGGARVYEFFQDLVRNGYVPPGAATLSDDDYAATWGEGLIAATAFFPSWMNIYQRQAIEAGKRTEQFPVIFVPFPRVPEVENVATYSMYGVVVIRKTGTEADRWAARFVEYLNDAESQRMGFVGSGGTAPPIRRGVDVEITSEHVAQTSAIFEAGGYIDVGLTSPLFPSMRPQHYPVLQKVLNLQVTPEAGIREYADRLTAVLNQ